jgi:hypothetical protein
LIINSKLIIAAHYQMNRNVGNADVSTKTKPSHLAVVAGGSSMLSRPIANNPDMKNNMYIHVGGENERCAARVGG